MNGAGGTGAPDPRGDSVASAASASRWESKAIRRGIGAAWLNVAVALVVAPLQTAMLVRWLAPADAGFWLIVLSFNNYVALFDLGLGPTLTRTIALLVSHGPGRKDFDGVSPAVGRAALGDVVATARSLYAALGGALLVVAFVVGPWLLEWTAERSFAGADAWTWMLFAVGGALTLVAAFPYVALAGEGLVGIGLFARAASQAVGLIGTFLALTLSRSTVSVAVAWVVQSVVLAGAGAFAYWRLAPHDRWRGTARRHLVAELLDPSLRWTWMSLGAALLLSGGTVLVSRHLGVAAVPSYAVLQQLFGSLRTTSLIPVNAATPFISRAYGGGDLAALREHLLRSLRHASIPLVAGVSVLAAFGDDAIVLWVGPLHFAGWAAVWLFAASTVVESHYTVHATTVMATGRLVFVSWTLAAAAIGLASGSVLVPLLGVVGMVVAWVTAQVATMGWFAPWYSLRRFDLSARSYWLLTRRLGLLLASCLAMAAVARALLVAFGVPPGAVRVGVGVLVLGPMLVPWVWTLALEPSERGQVIAALKRLAGGGGKRAGDPGDTT